MGKRILLGQAKWRENNQPNPAFKLRTFDCSFEDFEWKSEELYGACHACGDDEVYRVEPDACCNPCPSCDGVRGHGMGDAAGDGINQLDRG